MGSICLKYKTQHIFLTCCNTLLCLNAKRKHICAFLMQEPGQSNSESSMASDQGEQQRQQREEAERQREEAEEMQSLLQPFSQMMQVGWWWMHIRFAARVRHFWRG
jgi:hypothetical protein